MFVFLLMRVDREQERVEGGGRVRYVLPCHLLECHLLLPRAVCVYVCVYVCLCMCVCVSVTMQFRGFATPYVASPEPRISFQLFIV